jgi:hypothetical protein
MGSRGSARAPANRASAGLLSHRVKEKPRGEGRNPRRLGQVGIVCGQLHDGCFETFGFQTCLLFPGNRHG